MDDATLSPAAERLLAAAMTLFAEKGYERTSVGEIQEAAGLTFGSGALYKHFASKEAVLAEGVDRFVAHAANQRTGLSALDDLAPPEALTAIAQLAMASFAADRDALRIAWRDLEPFPELLEKVRTERIRATFDDFAAWLDGRVVGERATGTTDTGAVAAVALSALAFFQLLRFLLGDTPGGVDEERFVAAWAGLFAGVLGADDVKPAKGAKQAKPKTRAR
jgi:AcrR family transcriptional regulator